MRTPRRLRLEGHAGSRQPLTKAAVKGWIHTGTGTYTRRDMRILHTSDWHLGRHFGTQPLLEDQREFLRWLLEVVKEHRVELVVVAGDVFDRAVPAAEAVEAWREALLRLRSLDARVVAIAGNHDGPARLAAYDGLTDLAGVWVRGGYARAGEILSIEELGLCERGSGGRFIADGVGEMTGRLPVNPSGGLLSKGEPLGASALGQVVELVLQLRGCAERRQVEGAKIAVGHTVGRGANASIVVLAR